MLPDPTPLAAAGRFRLAPRPRFLLVAAGLYLAWLVGYERFIGPDGRLDGWLSVNIAAASAGLLRALGFAAGHAAGSPLVMMDGRPAVWVGAPCDGLVLYALFAGFILAFPGPARAKRWFIPLGIGAIYLLNIARVGALALNHHYARRSVDFNHHYTFAFVVYAFICLLWVQWVRRYGSPAGAA